MTLREKLADWLTGGKCKLRSDVHKVVLSAYRECESDCCKYESALNAIIAQETPTANATVKRMAKIAREAM